MGRTIEIASSSWINPSYTVDDVKFNFVRWRDNVGEKCKSKLKSVPSSINYQQNNLLEKAQPLAKIDEEEIKYDSKKFEIDGLKMDE